MTLAQAATLNVCKSGCTYSTIQSAIDMAAGGDTVLVDDGVYTENINFNGKAITVQSVNGADYTTIDGNASGSVVTFSSGEGADSVLDGFTIQNGSAYSGGGIYCYSSSPMITNCIISGNSATGYWGGGGGIYCGQSSSMMVTNCTIIGNTGNWAGGIWCNWYSSITVTNCTIIENSAFDCPGGGIYTDWYCSTTIVNSILWENTPSQTGYYESSFDVTYSDIKGGWTGTGNIDADPLFVGGGDYHLTAGSPCIDTGTDDTVTYPYLPADDIDGDARPQDGDGSGTAEYDMGSDEYVAVPPQGSISGCVMADGGYTPVAGARVNLFQGPTLLDFTFTDASAHYEFISLEDGIYRVMALKPSYGRDLKLGKVQQATPWGKDEFINLMLSP